MTGIFGAHRAHGLDSDKAEHWSILAACRDHDPELWFPVSKGNATEAKAVAICRQCPVLTRCAQEALTTKPEFGVWAAMTETQRRNHSGAYWQILELAEATQ
jgi:hypothetical protein